MNKYKVIVNGTEYEVLVELLGQGEASTEKKEAPKATAAPTAAPAATGEGETVKSPMPGLISVVNVKVGDKVKAGDTGMILEAMKMENEICIPCDGTVTSVAVSKGTTVETGTVLFTVKA